MNNSSSQYKKISLEISPDIAGIRLDKYLGSLSLPDLTRTKIKKLIEDNKITVNDLPAGHSQKLRGGEKVIVLIPPTVQNEVIPENIPLDIVFEDDHLLIVNKPAGMVTHPGAGNFSGTLVNAVMYHCRNLSEVQGIERAGIVHRLDKNTSGLIMIAKSDRVHLALQQQLKNHEIEKLYTAIICGHMKNEEGEIDLPIGRSLKDRKKMAVTHLRSRKAFTQYRVLERFKLHDLLEINLKTGRTHQIRVHFSHLGHPVLGDPDYGGRTKWHRGIYSVDKVMAQKALAIMSRQALHARSLKFKHPVTGAELILDSKLPDDFKFILELLRKGTD